MLRPEFAVLILAMADSLPVCEAAASTLRDYALPILPHHYMHSPGIDITGCDYRSLPS